MRLWSLHPHYLDTKGLVAVWREGLLAFHVLSGKTKGYTNHPQLQRFKEQADPITTIGSYLHYIVDEAEARNYNFNRSKLPTFTALPPIPVNAKQLQYEVEHLLKKLTMRDTDKHSFLASTKNILPHPLFTIISGPIESWEKV